MCVVCRGEELDCRCSLSRGSVQLLTLSGWRSACELPCFPASPAASSFSLEAKRGPNSESQ